MEIDYFFFAQTAELGENGQFSVTGGGVSEFGAVGFPVFLPSLCCVAHLKIASSEMGRTHHVRIEMADPQGKIVRLGVSDLEMPPGKRTYTLVIDATARFLVEGVHEIRVVIDEKVIAKRPLKITLMPDDGIHGQALKVLSA